MLVTISDEHCTLLQNFGYYVLLTELPTYLANILHFDIKSNSLYSAAPYLCCWVVAVVAPLVTDFIVARGFVSKTVARKMANTVATMGPGTVQQIDHRSLSTIFWDQGQICANRKNVLSNLKYY